MRRQPLVKYLILTLDKSLTLQPNIGIFQPNFNNRTAVLGILMLHSILNKKSTVQKKNDIL